MIAKKSGTNNGIHEDSLCKNIYKNGQTNGKETNGCIENKKIAEKKENGTNHKTDLLNGVK